jgi:hypothetical protein
VRPGAVTRTRSGPEIVLRLLHSTRGIQIRKKLFILHSKAFISGKELIGVAVGARYGAMPGGLALCVSSVAAVLSNPVRVVNSVSTRAIELTPS